MRAAYTRVLAVKFAFDMMAARLPRRIDSTTASDTVHQLMVIDRSEPEWLINTSMRVLPHMNADLAWKLQQARDLTGLRVPDVLTAMGFLWPPLEGMINWHCLVMAGRC